MSAKSIRIEVEATIIDPAKGRVHATIASGGDEVLLGWSAHDALRVGDALIQAANEAMRPCEVRPLKKKTRSPPHN